MQLIAAAMVILAGIWLIGLATAAFARPERVKQFLNAFASSAFTHCVEISIRIVIGIAFILYSPQMKFSAVFAAFGWLLILTSAVLLFVPWQLHKRFAERSLPLATKYMSLFGLLSYCGGLMILYSFFVGTETP
ncbi:MAG TPA: hypothetical protein PLP21_13375 [Pyrinomonadaceae bacterium]|nr:hypothetical protein [Acidobacteriota bacterium]HQZ97307.1 hypothetical protein [Pyrinomonadaceae bacterium]